MDSWAVAGPVYTADWRQIVVAARAIEHVIHVLVNCIEKRAGDRTEAGDHIGATLRATGVLLAVDHRHIGYVFGPACDLASSQRRSGYRAALRKAGSCDRTLATGREASGAGRFCRPGSLLSTRSRPTALPCDDDRIELPYQAAYDVGTARPQQLSVVACADIDVIAESLCRCDPWPTFSPTCFTRSYRDRREYQNAGGHPWTAHRANGRPDRTHVDRMSAGVSRLGR